jgi:hypothetical protein
MMSKLHQLLERWLSIRLNIIWPLPDSYLLVFHAFSPYTPYMPIHYQVVWYRKFL